MRKLRFREVNFAQIIKPASDRAEIQTQIQKTPNQFS